MPNYLAFTIGPIYQTMAGARYTRELWASSYLFSYLVKQITRRILQNERIPGNFILPSILGEQTSTYGVGIFPDRFIFETKAPDQLPELEKILEETLVYLATQMQRTAGITGPVLAFLKNYFKLYALEIPLDPATQNVILTIMPHLDSLELQHNFNSTDEPFLRQLFDRVTKSFLVQDGFREQQHSFETILEVATRDFSQLGLRPYDRLKEKRTGFQYNKAEANQMTSFSQIAEAEELDESELASDETSLISYLTANYRATLTPTPAKIFRPAHKYIAVIQADGDNVGKVIANLKPADYAKFSTKLSEFALNAVKEVVAFGGMNIYAGGDDLLFFAPLLYQQETLFDLLSRLDTLFTKTFQEFPVATGDPHPTLSFGVSVTYYKFPLYEAREAAAHQLFGVAKHIDGKNTIALRVQKHSGQPFGGAFRLKSASFDQLMALLQFSSEEDGQMLSSIVHKLHENRKLLQLIGHDNSALQAFFDNNFNEDIHKSHTRLFLAAIVSLLNACFAEHANAALAMDAAYALLRTHRFLTSTELN
ncbi:type III-B CRISPR-associated protein Cas10/Cmr2 [Spirosoma litoris]